MKGQRGRQWGTDSARRAKTTKAESPEEATGRKGRAVREGGSRRAAAHAKGWQGQQGATVSSNGCRRPSGGATQGAKSH